MAEVALAILRQGGVPPRIASYAVDSLALFVGATSYEEAIQARMVGDLDDAKAYVASINDYFSALPPDRFPMLVAMADDLTRWEEDDARFEFALDVQIRGIAALVAKHHAADRR